MIKLIIYHFSLLTYSKFLQLRNFYICNNFNERKLQIGKMVKTYLHLEAKQEITCSASLNSLLKLEISCVSCAIF